VAEAALTMPPEPPTRSGGLHGEHSEHLAPMLEVMQGLARAHPGATW
jgi:ring-1,2-phenylacetyl-CoA epoxidase subunit PaaC